MAQHELGGRAPPAYAAHFSHLQAVADSPEATGSTNQQAVYQDRASSGGVCEHFQELKELHHVF